MDNIEAGTPAPVLSSKHRVSRRFVATLGTNVLRTCLSFVTGIMLAQGFGPARFGDFNFLLATFVSLRSFIDMGSSSAFYTFISQEKRSPRFYLHYAYWLALQAGVVLLVVGLLLPQTWITRLWVGQSRSLLLPAFLAAFFSTAVWKAAESLGESRRESVWIQRIRLAMAVAHFLLVGAGYVQHVLNIPLIFFFLILENAAATFWCLWRFDWKEALGMDEPSFTVAADIRLYAAYCGPLALSSLVTFLWDYSVRWILQFYGGSSQQGYFSIGQQFATISLLATASLINIFWKEIAAAYGAGDAPRLRDLYHRTIDTLFFPAAAMSCCIIPFSQDILLCFLGPEYSSAWLSFSVLILFPVHQTLGQLNGSYFLAAHQTMKFFLFMVLGLVVTVPLCYFLVASHGPVVAGLGLGAFGMALNQVAVNFLLVNLEGWIICRSLGSRWPFFRQLGILAVLLALGFACRGIATWMIPAADTKVLLLSRMAAAGVLYLSATTGLAVALPAWTGFDIVWLRARLAA